MSMGMTVSASTAVNTCYAYSTEGLSLSYEGKQTKRTDKTYRLLIAVPKQRTGMIYYQLLLQDPAGKVFAYQELECHSYKNGDSIHCEAEGDRGPIDLNGNHALYLESIFLNDPGSKEASEWWLRDTVLGTVRSSHSIECPSAIRTKVLLPKGLAKEYVASKKDQTYIPGLYICYREKLSENKDGKVSVRYQGCTRMDEPCHTYGLKHFGHYRDLPDTGKALQRCKDSTPRNVH